MKKFYVVTFTNGVELAPLEKDRVNLTGRGVEGVYESNTGNNIFIPWSAIMFVKEVFEKDLTILAPEPSPLPQPELDPGHQPEPESKLVQ